MAALLGNAPHVRTIAAQSLKGLTSPDNGLVSPIHFATAYVRDESYAYPTGHVYGRSDNPTLQQAETLLCAMEGGDDAMLFGSGMSAAMAVVMAFDQPTHVLASSQMYYGLRRWLQAIGRFGHTFAFCDTSDLGEVEKALAARHPGLVWIETPSNPAWSITDISAVCTLAHDVGAIVCVDSTIATPVLTRPLAHGADLVMHSATKYLNGHSDINAGALVAATQDALWARIRDWRAEQGIALGTVEAWLLARSMRTLHLRVSAQSQTAALLAGRLQGHPAVARVLYPGLPSHPGHVVAARQMSGGFGGMLSIQVKGGQAKALQVARKTSLWKCATSLGGFESLIEHRATMEGADAQCADDLLRLSVGLEDPEDLLRDLETALSCK
ncbi:trans-sulfuration enzyme family protein [Bosea sp. PAMC 26642]|uniref:trans-sulfuration enzyme family protein n=1 Tax=Bosea sp. (strain PAMC 26642) TaxID=1792307 RepID=UPI0007701656|nr:PLP-dependent transferase [Bosea sp. PAMC 26642]AMJ59626.1 cystathionine gamma-synthase [Bosea sp. PAMC 26642]